GREAPRVAGLVAKPFRRTEQPERFVEAVGRCGRDCEALERVDRDQSQTLLECDRERLVPAILTAGRGALQSCEHRIDVRPLSRMGAREVCGATFPGIERLAPPDPQRDSGQRVVREGAAHECLRDLAACAIEEPEPTLSILDDVSSAARYAG